MTRIRFERFILAKAHDNKIIPLEYIKKYISLSLM
jgi:hypothetical protein